MVSSSPSPIGASIDRRRSAGTTTPPSPSSPSSRRDSALSRSPSPSPQPGTFMSPRPVSKLARPRAGSNSTSPARVSPSPGSGRYPNGAGAGESGTAGNGLGSGSGKSQKGLRQSSGEKESPRANKGTPMTLFEEPGKVHEREDNGIANGMTTAQNPEMEALLARIHKLEAAVLKGAASSKTPALSESRSSIAGSVCGSDISLTLEEMFRSTSETVETVEGSQQSQDLQGPVSTTSKRNRYNSENHRSSAQSGQSGQSAQASPVHMRHTSSSSPTTAKQRRSASSTPAKDSSMSPHSPPSSLPPVEPNHHRNKSSPSAALSLSGTPVNGRSLGVRQRRQHGRSNSPGPRSRAGWGLGHGVSLDAADPLGPMADNPLAESPHVWNHPTRMTLLDYVQVEVLGAEDHGTVDPAANKAVTNFLSVPRQLERLLLFGLLVCADTFLYVTTFLPMRIVLGAFCCGMAWLRGDRRQSYRITWLYDCMRGLMMVIAVCGLQWVPMSVAYHYIRGQAMIKLYVLIAMVEIFDKLMCSFGQDALDSLIASAQGTQKRKIFLHFVLMCVYVQLHSILLFIHVTTLTVAVNSSDHALLTLLISNNFAEIKSSVFKKFDRQNLFQLSCHDIVERFKLLLFLGMVMLLNFSQVGQDNMWAQIAYTVCLVFGGEVLADWVKHAFICKFNQLTPTLYQDYSKILARDMTACRNEKSSIMDHTHFVQKRLAFATVPLNCVMLRFLQIAAPHLSTSLGSCSWLQQCIIWLLLYVIAFLIKILTGIQLMAHSYHLHPEVVVMNTPGAAWLRSPAGSGAIAHKTQKELSLEKLSSIGRFTLWKGRIV
ncbi:unnamed protein product [Chrysoparadoxa australica]